MRLRRAETSSLRSRGTYTIHTCIHISFNRRCSGHESTQSGASLPLSATLSTQARARIAGARQLRCTQHQHINIRQLELLAQMLKIPQFSSERRAGCSRIARVAPGLGPKAISRGWGWLWLCEASVTRACCPHEQRPLSRLWKPPSRLWKPPSRLWKPPQSTRALPAKVAALSDLPPGPRTEPIAREAAEAPLRRTKLDVEACCLANGSRDDDSRRR